MADSWTTPATYTTGQVVSAADLNLTRDNLDALKAGVVGDASVDADIKQAIKTGTLAARPAASQAGRQYYATDIDAMYVDTGTAWRFVSGKGAFDSFDRASADALGTGDSGHGWTEHAGDIDIVNNEVARPEAANSLATVDLGAPLLTAHYGMLFQVGGVVTDLDAALVLRYVDTTNFLWLQALGNPQRVRLNTTIAGTTVMREELTVSSFVVSEFYFLEAFVRGPVVMATISVEEGGAPARLTYGTLANTFTPFSAATRAGIRFGAAFGAGNQWALDFFAIPNA